MFLEFWTQSSRDPALWETAIAPYRHFLTLFAAAFQKGVAEGAFQPVDPRLTAQALMALAMGIVLQGVMDPQGAAWNEVAQQGIALLLAGLRPGAQG